MEITPMEKTSDQIQGMSKCYLGITYYLLTAKTVATGHEKSVTADGPLNAFKIFRVEFHIIFS